MQIEYLMVKNFRNLAQQKIEFGEKLNVLYGKNAQGKTNTLEAIYLSTIGRSPRTRKDSEMIAFKESSLETVLGYNHKGAKHQIEINITPRLKQISVDKNKLTRIADIIGNFGSVYFSPDELKLVQGSPANRRRFLDIILCQLSKKYLTDLKNFQKVLNQRNSLLKLGDETQIEVWNESLAIYAEKLFVAREKFFEKIKQNILNMHLSLTSGQEELSLQYESALTGSESLIKDYLAGLSKSLERDKVLGYTTFGLQNDDFSVISSGLDLRKNGSQGQQRTATLSLKLAELEILKEEYGEYPVLLLDDVLSELDETRREKLLTHINNLQCILTCTEFYENLPCKKFKVENGLVKEE